ncbi:MAG: right-handed parallel beta-helix repeat-containing protein [Capnocytophaga sp.]|nr:right-handed parallel beta-helix repeat-containing protein [Capnocytophaga sp.]
MKTCITLPARWLSSFFLVGILLLSACNSTPKGNELSFADITSQIDTVTNFSPLAQQLIALAAEKNASDSVVIRLEKRDYHFRENGASVKELYISNHDQDNPKKVAFYLENLKNATIDGNGSNFIFHGRMIPIVLKNCENVTLKNFSVDFELPHLRQLEIKEVDAENDISIAEIYPQGNYSINGGKLVIEGEGYAYAPFLSMAFDADKKLTHIRRDVNFNPKEVKELSPNRLQISGWYQNAQTKPGERYVLRTYYRPAPGIVIDYCRDTYLDNVTVHYAEGMGLIAQMSENITLNRFSVALKGESDPRYFTTQADATHFSACKGVIRSENGLYEGMADDAINVHGTYLKVKKRIDNQSVIAVYMHPQAYGFLWGEAGDKVQFIASKTMDLVDAKTYTIKEIKSVDKPTEFGAKEFEITFTEAIPDVISSENSFGIENLTWTPEVIFSNNIIRNNRARGALFSTPKRVICENNVFDHTHGTAILLCGDCNGWYETGACREVIIRNNKFINALTATYQFTNAVISIYPEIPDLEGQTQFFHSGIVIENNEFEMFDKPILYAKSVDNLIFRNNKITTNNDYEPFHWNTYPFFFERVKNVQIIGNQSEKPFSITDVMTNLSDDDAVSVE